VKLYLIKTVNVDKSISKDEDESPGSNSWKFLDNDNLKKQS